MENIIIEKQKEIIDIEDVEEAKNFIRKAIEQGELPIITVPLKYAEVARKGIASFATWIGESITAGTISREPYIPKGEERVIFKITVLPEQVEPRFTGPDKHFHGVVVFRGPISPESLELAV
ncbi:MAG: hypothetical protein HY773_02440 [Candidatus Terrybacteria bacterium]|nr:hypothetical protein [Candidatus Terrybacteria bacterium]